MMNGEIPSVPITTLAGISSLTGLLPELPLPSPLPHTVNNKSLLYHPKIADDAKKLLATRDRNLVSQLAHALRQTNTDHIELKDNLAEDSIEGDVPELLKALLGQDPSVFKGGAPIRNNGGGRSSMGGAQHFNQHPQQPSPYQAGQISPCPPGSPARFPPQPGSSPSRFHGQTSPYGHQEIPTVNGGLSSSPTTQGAATPPHPRSRSHAHSRSSTISSPAQAAAAPVQRRHHEDRESSSRDRSRHRNSSSSRGAEPVVVLKPLTSEEDPLRDINQVQLTRRSLSSSSSKSDVNKSRLGMRPSMPTEDVYQMPTSRRSTSSRNESNKSKLLPTELLQPTVKLMRIDSMEADLMAARLSHSRSSRSRDDRRGSKRRHSEEEEDYIESNWHNRLAKKKKKEKKVRRGNDLLSTEELMESPIFRRFGAIIEGILESAEDIDMGALDDEEEEEERESSDAVITRSTLQDLSNEAAKLKSMGVLNQVPYEKLVKVLHILQINIKDGCKTIPLNEDEGHDEEQLWRELAYERVVTALDAALTALYIMTAPNMPKQVYVEDVIERLVMMAKIQCQNTIFPEFDPVYRVHNSKQAYQSNMKMKRARAANAKHKSTVTLYNKITEVIGCLAELVGIQELTDTIILQTSTLAVTPFFVENISELQLNALKLVTNIFSRYRKHRQLILEDILSSLARLPSSKKNLRSYRLNADEQIQMVTALALELIQCVIKLPKPRKDDETELPAGEDQKKNSKNETANNSTIDVDSEVIFTTSYDTAMRTAHNFLAVFLRKCAVKGEEDYRPLFENFVYDLLATVNKPEWPAAELLLSLLGRLLVQQFSNKSVDMSMRVASLDYLGIVAARLRKDAVTSLLKEEVIDDIIAHINGQSDEESGSDAESSRKKSKRKSKDGVDVGDRTECLQKALLQYLVYNAQNDPALVFSWQFYIAQWYRDTTMEVERVAKGGSSNSPMKTPPKAKARGSRRSSRRGREQEEEEVVEVESEEEEEDQDPDKVTKEIERTKEVQQMAERRKAFLLLQINVKVGAFATFKPSPSKLDYENALTVTRYLASNRPFSQSFDIYLTQILKVLCETAVAVRTKAMKCLSAVVEADPGILARMDMQKGVHGRFLDQSTSVREAAIELVGKFILIRPELTTQYYDMLTDRILDTGISVRKRVIKIFRDICIEQPEFQKIPEMCVKMIRRVNDEEGIKKLINETFQTMWFSPVRDKDAGKLLTRVMNITDVVAACRDSGVDWFEQLLENLLKKEEVANSKPVNKACMQIVDCLVDNVLTLEGTTGTPDAKGSGRLIACLSTLYLFCKVQAELLVPHATTIHPYLNIKCNTQADFLVLHNVARILELAVPLMEHPSESFLAQLEEDMMKLILKHGMTVLQSCVSCLGAVVNSVTHNYKLVRDCFQKFFGVLSRLMAEHKKDAESPQLANSRPTLLRSLFTVGLLCKHFDFDSEDFGEKRDVPETCAEKGSVKVSIKDRVFDVILYFVGHEDDEVKHKALTGLGFLCTRHYEFMMDKRLRDLYHDMLAGDHSQLKNYTWMHVQVLKNLQTYLTEEEEKMIIADAEWRKHQDKEDLKEMGDIQSGMASTVIQVYLKQVLESFFHFHSPVRIATLSVIILVLRQGLVHPVQCVPYLVSMGTDCDSQVRVKADQQLQEIDKKYPGFIQMKALQGIKFSYRLQTIIGSDGDEPARGVRYEENNCLSLNNYIYTLIRSNRNHRRALLSCMLNMFDDTTKTTLGELLYMADNIGYFPYVVQDEPLYIIHQIDILVSVSGSNLLQSFQEKFYPGSTEEGKGLKFDEDEDEQIDVLLGRMPEDVSQLQELFLSSQGCLLLLVLKQHLKEMYGFTDNKIHLYSPTETAKTFDKSLSRRHNTKMFNPSQVLDIIKKGPLLKELDEQGKRALIESYLDFKDLMLSIDPDDQDDEDLNATKGPNTPGAEGAANTSGQEGGKPAGEPGSGNPGQSANKDVVDLTADGPGANKATVNATTPNASHHQSHSPSSHRLSSDRKRVRPSSSSSSRSSKSRHLSHHHSHHHHHHHSKPHKHKKKKRKRLLSDSGEDSEDDSDPDFVA